jgi:hypothetical protein
VQFTLFGIAPDGIRYAWVKGFRHRRLSVRRNFFYGRGSNPIRLVRLSHN